jgi:hypothetical protein
VASTNRNVTLSNISVIYLHGLTKTTKKLYTKPLFSPRFEEDTVQIQVTCFTMWATFTGKDDMGLVGWKLNPFPAEARWELCLSRPAVTGNVATYWQIEAVRNSTLPQTYPLDSWPEKIGPTVVPETSSTKLTCTPCATPKPKYQYSSHGESLKSSIISYFP